MKTKILFLDDEPGIGRRVKSMLSENGYSFSESQNLGELEKLIDSGEVGLVFHCTNDVSNTHGTLCEKLEKRFPMMPFIHMVPAKGKHPIPRNIYCRQLRHLASKREILNLVKQQIMMGELSRENELSRKVFEFQKRVDGLLNEFDSHEFKMSLVKFMCSEFKASEVYYLDPGAYGYFLNESWKVKTIRDGAPVAEDAHQLISAKKEEPKELSQLLLAVSEKLKSGWELRKSVTTCQVENKLVRFIPFVDPQEDKVIAHAVVVNSPALDFYSNQITMTHLARTVSRHIKQLAYVSDARGLSFIDDCTQLYNQRYLHKVLDREIARSERMNSTFSVLFMDMDHFKKINDTKGHVIGSRVLAEIGKILQDSIRSVDFAFRYGGDEFILVLVGTGSDGAFNVAERIREQIENTTFTLGKDEVKATLSIGIATFPEHAATKEKIIELADRAMYCGKRKSRNVVYVAS